MEEFSEKVKQYMTENMSTSGAKKKKKKKDKDKTKEAEDQPSSSKHSSEKGSMFDQFRGRSIAHKKAAVVPGEAEDQPPLPLRRATRSAAQSSALPVTSVATSHAAMASIPANVPICSTATLPANVATCSSATFPADVATSSTDSVPVEGIPTDTYEPVVTSSASCPFKIYKIEGKEEEHQRGNE